MRINAIVEPMKYNEHREINEKNEHNGKQNSNTIQVPFSEVLKRVKGDLYLKSNVKRVNQLKYPLTLITY